MVSLSVYIGVCAHIEEDAGSETGRALGKITIALIHFHQRLIGLLIYRHGLRVSEVCDLRLAASFEASAAPLPEARRIFQENLDECSMGPFLR